MFEDDDSVLHFFVGVLVAFLLLGAKNLISPRATFVESAMVVTRIQKAGLSDGCYIKTKYVDDITNRNLRFYAPCDKFQYGDTLVLTSVRHQRAKSNGNKTINNSKNVKIDVNID